MTELNGAVHALSRSGKSDFYRSFEWVRYEEGRWQKTEFDIIEQAAGQLNLQYTRVS